MKHTTKLINGYYWSKHNNEYRVIVDKYSGNNYRVVAVFDPYMTRLIGRTLVSGHTFRRALKKEQDQFKLFVGHHLNGAMDDADDLVDAINTIKGWEEEDKENGCYEDGEYEIETYDNMTVYVDAEFSGHKNVGLGTVQWIVRSI